MSPFNLILFFKRPGKCATRSEFLKLIVKQGIGFEFLSYLNYCIFVVLIFSFFDFQKQGCGPTFSLAVDPPPPGLLDPLHPCHMLTTHSWCRGAQSIACEHTYTLIYSAIHG